MTGHNVTPCVTLYTAVSRVLECWTGPTIVTGIRADRSLGFTDPGRAVAISMGSHRSGGVRGEVGNISDFLSKIFFK
jgi:hypothetical protein